MFVASAKDEHVSLDALYAIFENVPVQCSPMLLRDKSACYRCVLMCMFLCYVNCYFFYYFF